MTDILNIGLVTPRRERWHAPKTLFRAEKARNGQDIPVLTEFSGEPPIARRIENGTERFSGVESFCIPV
jgi:hypothetical protein